MVKLQTFAATRFDISENNLISHEHRFSMGLSRISAEFDNLAIRKPIPPSARILQIARSGGTISGLPRGSKVTSAALDAPGAAPVKAPTAAPAASSAPPAASSAPPPYSAAPSAGAAAEPKPAGADYVVAMYDYTATADGDLSFRTGDQIEVVQRTASAEDWWTGRLNGVQGVFPGCVSTAFSLTTATMCGTRRCIQSRNRCTGIGGTTCANGILDYHGSHGQPGHPRARVSMAGLTAKEDTLIVTQNHTCLLYTSPSPRDRG